MSWKDQCNAGPLVWLLEPEPPGVLYLALRDLLDCPADDTELLTAKVLIITRAASFGGAYHLIEHRTSIEEPGTTTP